MATHEQAPPSTALTDEQLAADCAVPGRYVGGSFDRGWARILACLAATGDAAAGDAGEDVGPTANHAGTAAGTPAGGGS